MACNNHMAIMALLLLAAGEGTTAAAAAELSMLSVRRAALQPETYCHDVQQFSQQQQQQGLGAACINPSASAFLPLSGAAQTLSSHLI
jgi:deoxyribose-phosphate aldolase